MPDCKRCGICCHYYNDEGKLLKCPQLIKIGSIYGCRIYKNRLGYKIAKLKDGDVVCSMREQVRFDYPDCPYNTGKPMFSWEGVKEHWEEIKKETERRNNGRSNI